MSSRIDFRPLLASLTGADARFVIIGAVAMVLHGADYTTFDLDICYEPTRSNVSLILGALAPHSDAVRSAPTDLVEVLVTNRASVRISTDYGDLDLLAEVTGLGGYADVVKLARPVRVNGGAAQLLTLGGLIRAKEALNRLKDQQHLVTLRALNAMDRES